MLIKYKTHIQVILLVLSLNFSIFFVYTFKSLGDFMTRESIMTSSLIFLVFSVSILLKDIYISHKESKIKPVQTYFDKTDEALIDDIELKEEVKETQTIEEEFKMKFSKPSIKNSIIELGESQ